MLAPAVAAWRPGRAMAMGAGACVAARRAADGDRVRYSPSRPDAAVSVATARPAVALGVDDGPDPRFTPLVLAALARHRARATFFVVGRSVAAHPELAAAAAAAGHEVGHHSWSHEPMVGRPAAEVAGELARTAAALARAGVTPAALLRTPRGRQDGAAAEAACRAGLRTVGWSANLERHRGDPEALARALAPGDVVLAHDGRLDRTASVAALDRLLAELRRRGLAVVPVGELLGSAGVGR